VEEGIKVVEAVGDSERTGHPFERGVIVAERVDGGGSVEDVEVVVGEQRVVAELGLEEMEEVGGGDRRCEMVVEEVEEETVVGGRVVEESESGCG
jgi:hypothetical protein